MRLTKTFSTEQFRDALDSWRWLGIEGKAPLLTSLFGDVFLQDAQGYWFLDSMEGSLTLQWDSRQAIQASLESAEGQDRYLLGGLAWAAEQRGLVLADNEIYEVNPPPVLGGAMAVENVVKMDFVVSLNIAGQIHEQVRAHRAGTTITGITVDGQSDVTPPTE